MIEVKLFENSPGRETSPAYFFKSAMTTYEIAAKIAELALRQNILIQRHSALLRDKPLLYRTRAAALRVVIRDLEGQIAAWKARLKTK